MSEAKARVESLSHRESRYAGGIAYRGHATAPLKSSLSRNEMLMPSLLACLLAYMLTPDRRTSTSSNLSVLGRAHVAPTTIADKLQYDIHLPGSGRDREL